MIHRKTHTIVFSALCIALGLYLPFLSGQIPQIGGMLCPMHIPAFLCGMLCGWQWGVIAGGVMPLLRSVLFGMPPMMPTALAMAFELAAYGGFSGLLTKLLSDGTMRIYLTLILSMILGRIVWGIASAFLYMFSGSTFTFAMFITAGFVNALPGIALHLIVIPPIVWALRKTSLTRNYND